MCDDFLFTQDNDKDNGYSGLNDLISYYNSKPDLNIELK